MHSRMLDLARRGTAACWHEPEAANDNKVSVLWWLVPCFAFWCAIVWWWI